MMEAVQIDLLKRETGIINDRATCERMKSLTQRLASYVGRDRYHLQTILNVAENGLFHLDCDGMLCCAWCRTQIDSRCLLHATARLTLVHWHRSGRHCEFLRKNRPLEDYSADPIESFYRAFSGNQSPRELSDAGFIFMGEKDAVSCRCCEVSLDNWLDGYDAFVQHAFHTQGCAYLSHVKGDGYRESVINNYDDICDYLLLKSNDQHVIAETEVKRTVMATVDDEMMTSCLRQPRVRCAIRLGFQPFLIRTIFHDRLETSGLDFESDADFLQALVGGKNRYLVSRIKRLFPELTHSHYEGRDWYRMPSLVDVEGIDNDQLRRQQSAINSVNMRSPSNTPSRICGKTIQTLRPMLNYTLIYYEDSDDVDHKELTGTQVLLDNANLKVKSRCQSCLVKLANVVCLPCGHLSSCLSCSSMIYRIPNCSICANPIRRLMPVRSHWLQPDGEALTVTAAVEEENRLLRNLCVVCHKESATVFSRRCRHIAMCHSCAFTRDTCPIASCRLPIEGTFPIYQ